MTDYVLKTKWPEMGLSTGEESDEESEQLKEWLNDPFKRRVLYAFHAVYISTRVLTLAALMTISLAGSVLLVPDLVTTSGTFWVLLMFGLILEGLDSVLDNPIDEFAGQVSYHLFVNVAKIYLSMRNSGRNGGPNVSEDNFASWIDQVFEAAIVERENRRKLI